MESISQFHGADGATFPLGRQNSNWLEKADVGGSAFPLRSSEAFSSRPFALATRLLRGPPLRALCATRDAAYSPQKILHPHVRNFSSHSTALLTWSSTSHYRQRQTLCQRQYQHLLPGSPVGGRYGRVVGSSRTYQLQEACPLHAA